jgi:hypothetical protein
LWRSSHINTRCLFSIYHHHHFASSCCTTCLCSDLPSQCCISFRLSKYRVKQYWALQNGSCRQLLVAQMSSALRRAVPQWKTLLILRCVNVQSVDRACFKRNTLYVVTVDVATVQIYKIAEYVS